MSELIDNREHRQKVLREIIGELHEGKSVEEVKARFEETFSGISTAEIAALEEALIREGMPVSEIQRLCDVHAAILGTSIEEIHREEKPEDIPGHPIYTFRQENRRLEQLLAEQIKPNLATFMTGDSKEARLNLQKDLNLLWQVDKHYSRKENLVFPFMEKYGITAPPKVMWGVDDEIRATIKEAGRLLDEDAVKKDLVKERIEEAVSNIKEMIFKEESILFPMALETLTEEEWFEIATESAEIGYCLIEAPERWQPANINLEAKVQAEGEKPADGYLRFPSGILSLDEITSILNTLPIDITFVDKEGLVKYFSQGSERIFARPTTIIGRRVNDCHPPASVHIVETIIADLQSGQKDDEAFWIKMGHRYVYIRYFAVRNKDGEYLGTLEVTQDIKPIQNISGEKRLFDLEP